MRVSQRLLAVLLFTALSLLALAVSGLLDWVTGVLFLALELLADSLRRLFGRREPHRHHAPHRHRPPAVPVVHVSHRPRRLGARKGLPGHSRVRPGGDDPSPPDPSTPKVRVLLPLDDDRPELVAFALDECRSRQAELLLLFLRPLAVVPMGPNPPLTLAEDDRARSVLDRLGDQAKQAGVPFRTLYEVTHDRAATILAAARAFEADVLLLEAPRRRRLWSVLAGDVTQDILRHLPGHVNLLIHAA
jgi:nucleotide-binding universal stress UspA family protein